MLWTCGKITRGFLGSGRLVLYGRDGSFRGDGGGEARDGLPASGRASAAAADGGRGESAGAWRDPAGGPGGRGPGGHGVGGGGRGGVWGWGPRAGGGGRGGAPTRRRPRTRARARGARLCASRRRPGAR